MGEVSTSGLDLAKLVFQAHGADQSGAVIFRKKLRRDQVLAFFAAQPTCLVAMEASRRIALLGARNSRARARDEADPSSLRQAFRQLARIAWALMARGGSYKLRLRQRKPSQSEAAEDVGRSAGG